jgi:uncharacterized protein (DUF2062 family)
MTKKLRQWLSGHLHRLCTENCSPHDVALGFSLGTFINILAPGISIFIALLVLLVYRRLNKLSFFVALAVWNWVTLVPVYALSYEVGSRLFGHLPRFSYDLFKPDKIMSISKNLILANLIVAGVISVCSYFLVRQVVAVYRRRKERIALKTGKRRVRE